MCTSSPPTGNICYLCGSDHVSPERSGALVPAAGTPATNTGVAHLGVPGRNAYSAFSVTVSSRDFYNTVIPYLGPRGVGTLSGTCRHFYSLMRKITQDENVLLQLLRRHFPNTVPTSTNLNTGALMRPRCLRSAFQSWQRLGAEGSQAVCLKSFQIGDGSGVSVACMQMTPDGKRVLVGGRDGSLIVLDPDMGNYHVLGSHDNRVICMQMNSDGTRALSGAGGDHPLMLWDLETGKLLRTLIESGGATLCLQIAADGRRAVSGSEDGTLRIWNLEKGECMRTLTGHGGPVNHIQVTSDGRRVFSGSHDQTVKIWDPETGQCLQTLPSRGCSVTSLQLTSDGSRILTAFTDGTIRLSDLESGESLRTFGVTERVEWLHILPDGRRVLAASSHDRLRLWDLETGECVRTLTGHRGQIYCLQITSDGRRAVSGCEDGTSKLWDLETGECLQTLDGYNNRPASLWRVPRITCLQITPDGKRVLSGNWMNQLNLWEVFPLLEERITATYNMCGSNPSHVHAALCSLPQCAQDDFLAIEREFRQRNESSQLNEIAILYRCLEIHAAQIALPDIRASLRRAVNEPLFLAESIRRVANLPRSIKEAVYGNLFVSHPGQRAIPYNEAESAFSSEGSAFIEARIEAVSRTLRGYAVSQLTPAYQLPVTARIAVRYEGNLSDRLYIRGSGPGMEGWRQGIEMRHVNRLWIYESAVPFERFEFKVLLNDHQWEMGANHTISSGAPVMLHSVTFPVLPSGITARIVVRHQGNTRDRLYIRGSGHLMFGWDRGIEMRHENGLWIYDSSEPFVGFEFKIMLNDLIWEAGDNHTISTGVPVVLDSVIFQSPQR